MAEPDDAARSGDVGPNLFDRFADVVARFTSRAWFFVACLSIVIVWGPSIFVIKDLDTWQLIINTTTTIVTFLLVALLQNTQTRSDAALQQKLNAIADGLHDLLEKDHKHDAAALNDAVGLEERESSS